MIELNTNGIKRNKACDLKHKLTLTFDTVFNIFYIVRNSS